MEKIHILPLLVAIAALSACSRHPSAPGAGGSPDPLEKTVTNKDGSVVGLKAFGPDGKEVAITNIQIR